MEETASRGPDHPFYDSLLLKVIAYGRKFEDVRRKAMRALQETQIKGVETNIPFLLNVLNHPAFAAGTCDTGFIARNPDLLDIKKTQDREQKVLAFLGNKYVNESKGKKPYFNVPVFPRFQDKELAGLQGTRQLFEQLGIGSSATGS